MENLKTSLVADARSLTAVVFTLDYFVCCTEHLTVRDKRRLLGLIPHKEVSLVLV